MVSLKKKSESLIKYYIKVTCAFKWARKLPPTSFMQPGPVPYLLKMKEW